jgi:hypothetical protein
VNRSLFRATGVGALLVVCALAGADEADPPEILHVAVTRQLVAGQRGEARVRYRAPGANVAAVVMAVEDRDGARRVTTQRELSMVGPAFGREEGDLFVPIAFATPGRKRIVFTLLTDERQQSEPASIEVEVVP